MLRPTAYTDVAWWENYVICINMILHTVFLILVDFSKSQYVIGQGQSVSKDVKIPGVSKP